MLSLTVKLGKEKIKIGDAVLCVHQVQSNVIRLAIDAPREIKIERIQEEYQCIRKKKKSDHGNQTEKSSEPTHLDYTHQTLRRLKKSMGQSRNGLIKQSKRSSDCVICFNKVCGCRV